MDVDLAIVTERYVLRDNDAIFLSSTDGQKKREHQSSAAVKIRGYNPKLYCMDLHKRDNPCYIESTRRAFATQASDFASMKERSKVLLVAERSPSDSRFKSAAVAIVLGENCSDS
jgi:hypothetical protein